MPIVPKIKPKYFAGTTDDLAAIYAEMNEWLAATRVVTYQLNSTVHFDPDKHVWHILITVMYQEPQTVLAPTLMMGGGRRAD